MARILATGIVTLDHTLDVAAFPAEDDEVRALASTTQPGGNATNTATILAQFGHRPGLAAVIAEGAAGDALSASLEGHGLDVCHCVRRPGATPTSHILRSRATGSRTIVHHRDLPELGVEDLAGVPWPEYDWLHFEGRNPEALASILRAVRESIFDQPVSLELEKPRPGLDACMDYADVLMLSRDWAASVAGTPEAALQQLSERFPDRILTVTAGGEGAWMAVRGAIHHCEATPGLRVVDSVGAGDTFNAGLIHALVSGEPPEQTLTAAVRLAERKLEQVGLDGLGNAASDPGAWPG
ncbi:MULTISPECIES: PfkB family carbohydrate kinase [unclassified Thioalkalivibrio]|uniref:PfkB family carbohydrate kinase n=1 Tax=unclassified Thioalkalivibrio TaxID=2621013 RepID=UPI000382DCDF|nr:MULTISPECIES: PfkB family carbohydrate kinase [unclassified Thioalkalivibrio]